MNIANNIILITGGGSGIGLALAKAFSKHRNTIILLGRNEEKLIKATQQIPNSRYYCCDLTDEPELNKCIATVTADYPNLNVIINNAGLMQVENVFEGHHFNSSEKKQFDINYFAPVHLVHGLLDFLTGQKQAAIINVSTALVDVPLAATPSYCASKSALHAYTVALRTQLKKSSVHVCEIFPPIVDTSMSSQLGIKGMSPDDFARKVLKKLSQNASEIRVGQAKLLHFFSKFNPAMIRKKMDQHLIDKQQKLSYIIAVFVMSVFVANSALSQDATSFGATDSESSRFIWGGKAGATLNQFNQPGTVMGFTAGLVGSYEVTDYFTVQGELLYKLSGDGRADATRNLQSEVLQVTYLNRAVMMQSIEIPAMLFFTLPELNEGNIVPRLGVGASYGYCFVAFEYHDKIYTLSDGTQTILGNRSENIMADIESHQFAFKVGLAIDYKLEDGKILGTEMRYSRGLNDVNLYKTTYTGSAQFPTTLSLALSLKF